MKVFLRAYTSPCFPCFHPWRAGRIWGVYLARYSPIAHASADDSPAILLFTKADKPPVKGEPQSDPTDSAVLGLMLKDRLDALGVPCEERYPGDGSADEAKLTRVLIDNLTLQ